MKQIAKKWKNVLKIFGDWVLIYCNGKIAFSNIAFKKGLDLNSENNEEEKVIYIKKILI